MPYARDPPRWGAEEELVSTAVLLLFTLVFGWFSDLAILAASEANERDDGWAWAGLTALRWLFLLTALSLVLAAFSGVYRASGA